MGKRQFAYLHSGFEGVRPPPCVPSTICGFIIFLSAYGNCAFFEPTLPATKLSVKPIMELDINKNEDINKQLVYELNTRLKKVHQGGGEKAAAKQKEKGKMLARERIAYLLDQNKPWLEVGAFVADGMYAEHGGCPSGGVVCGIGYVSGWQCVIVANDATVKAWAWFPITA